MGTEIKNCQQCKNQFTIEPEDFEFYKKMQVPPPTWCVQCRMQRRLSWCADSTTLYQRVCQAPGHNERIVSIYPEVVQSPVYDYKFWVSDGWDGMSYGRDYDFSRPFFAQYKELLSAVPVRSTEIVNSVDCEYCLGATDSKNCYLCSGTFGSENCIYGHTAVFSKESVDATLSTFVQQAYDVISVDKSFQVTSSAYSDELVNCDFMYDCRGCTDCLGCVGLRNKKYCIFNVEYAKEEYKKERAKYDLGSRAVRDAVRMRYDSIVLGHPRKYAVIRNAPSCTGDNLINSKNCRHTFQALNDIENCHYSFVVGYGTKDSQDIAGAGLKSQLLYDAASIVASQDVAFSYRIRNSRDIRYARECIDSEYLFACAGLRSKKYCIFNKQYGKVEYEKLRAKIIEQMNMMPYKDDKGRLYRYGEFPPGGHSLFPYNSSWAMQEHFVESKESALAKGYWWYDAPVSHHAVTVPSSDVPDHIKDVPMSICEEILECARESGDERSCPGVFRIILKELEFYKKFNIALPRSCPACRFRVHSKYFTSYKLWHRRCMCHAPESTYKNTRLHDHGGVHCKNEFETAYEPGRPELLYCERCYNQEVIA